jgi:hypothetical protein
VSSLADGAGRPISPEQEAAIRDLFAEYSDVVYLDSENRMRFREDDPQNVDGSRRMKLIAELAPEHTAVQMRRKATLLQQRVAYLQQREARIAELIERYEAILAEPAP